MYGKTYEAIGSYSLGYLVTELILGMKGLSLPRAFGFAVLIIEIPVLGYGMYRILKGVRIYREKRAAGNDVYESVRWTLDKGTGLAAASGYLIHEISMFIYAFSFKAKQHAEFISESLFTYHLKSNALILVWFLVFMLLLEGFTLHLLFSQWSHFLVWAASASNVYILILYVADYRAMKINPIQVENGVVKIRYGLRAIMDIEVSQIVHVEASNQYELSKTEKKQSIAPSTDIPNLFIECDRPVQCTLMFGKPRSSGKIYLFLDEPAEFARYLNHLREVRKY